MALAAKMRPIGVGLGAKKAQADRQRVVVLVAQHDERPLEHIPRTIKREEPHRISRRTHLYSLAYVQLSTSTLAYCLKPAIHHRNPL